jgi:hypothetical protein
VLIWLDFQFEHIGVTQGAAEKHHMVECAE